MSGSSTSRGRPGFSFSRLGSSGGVPSLDPGLRSVLQQRVNLSGVALPTAARSLSGEEFDAMFRRLSTGRPSKGRAPRADNSVGQDLDSAQQTEASEMGSDSSGLLTLLDEGWFAQQPGKAPPRAAAALAGSPIHQSSETGAGGPSRSQPRSSARPPSPLDLPAGEPAFVGESGSPSSALASGRWPPAPPSDSMFSARDVLPAASSLSAAESASGWESPRSWATSQMSLPQAALDSMELSQLEALAAEAAALQQRAALAMQFARQRMGPPTAGLLRPIGEDGATPGTVGSTPIAAPPAAATKLPSLVLLAASLLQLLLLLALGLLLSAAAWARQAAHGVLGSPVDATCAAVRWVVQAWTALLRLLLASVPVRV